MRLIGRTRCGQTTQPELLLAECTHKAKNSPFKMDYADVQHLILSSLQRPSLKALHGVIAQCPLERRVRPDSLWFNSTPH